MRINLTKSQSYHHIKNKKVQGIMIQELIYFNKEKFRSNSNIIINRILTNFKMMLS